MQGCQYGNEKNICLAFYSIHLGIEVYEDGELIYNLKPVPGIFGTTPGSVWNFLEIDQDKTAIVMLDLNNLKKCNDRYGHEAGDTYLKKASEMITNAFSQENTVYRIGGDEFCVIMPDAKENSIEGAMDRLKELQKQYKGTDHSVEVEIACGYAFYDDNVDRSFVDTRKRADTHMYENKRMLKGKEPR